MISQNLSRKTLFSLQNSPFSSQPCPFMYSSSPSGSSDYTYSFLPSCHNCCYAIFDSREVTVYAFFEPFLLPSTTSHLKLSTCCNTCQLIAYLKSSSQSIVVVSAPFHNFSNLFRIFGNLASSKLYSFSIPQFSFTLAEVWRLSSFFMSNLAVHFYPYFCINKI